MDTTIKGYTKRFTILILGLAFAAYGVGLTVNANLGLSPWDVFAQGIAIQASKILGREILLGTVIQITGVFVLLIVILLKEKIGFGTLFDIALLGQFLNIYMKYGFLPSSENKAFQFAMLLAGYCIWAVGIYIYMAAGLGAGPRDSLMAALAKRNVPISLAKNLVEFTVFVIGWLLGGSVGVGTIVAVVAMGYIIKVVFTIFKFDITTVHNDSILETLQYLKKNFVKTTTIEE